jgi:hypothetical protein
MAHRRSARCARDDKKEMVVERTGPLPRASAVVGAVATSISSPCCGKSKKSQLRDDKKEGCGPWRVVSGPKVFPSHRSRNRFLYNAALSFVIPSEGEGSAVLRSRPGYVFDRALRSGDTNGTPCALPASFFLSPAFVVRPAAWPAAPWFSWGVCRRPGGARVPAALPVRCCGRLPNA